MVTFELESQPHKKNLISFCFVFFFKRIYTYYFGNLPQLLFGEVLSSPEALRLSYKIYKQN